MVKNCYTLLAVTVMVVFTAPVYSQVNPIIDLSGGYDYNLNKFYNKYVYEKSEGQTDYNAGVTLGITLGKRVRFRTGVNYAQFTYGQQYPSGFFTDNAGVSYTESEMTIRCIDLRPMLDGRLLTVKKIDLYVTAGYRFEWVVDDDEESIKSDGSTTSSHYLDKNFEKSNGGPFVGFIVKYNAGKHLGITFEPGYTYYLKKLYYQNDGSLQRLSANIGIAYTFLPGRKKAEKKQEEVIE